MQRWLLHPGCLNSPLRSGCLLCAPGSTQRVQGGVNGAQHEEQKSPEGLPTQLLSTEGSTSHAGPLTGWLVFLFEQKPSLLGMRSFVCLPSAPRAHLWSGSVLFML